MEDFKNEKVESYREVRRHIEELQNRLKSARSEFVKRDIVNELSKLEAERIQEENYFTDDATAQAVMAEEIPADLFPLLNSVWSRYSELVKSNRRHPRDILGMLVYLQYFDEEFLGFLSPRKLKLDVKYSMVRDTFYNSFSQLRRNVDGYREESERIGSGSYTKKYETDILKRMVEMRHSGLVEADRFFRRLRQFAGDLVDDLAGRRILCQNGGETLEFSTMDREAALRGLTVQEALQQLFDLADEAVAFMNVPDFRTR